MIFSVCIILLIAAAAYFNYVQGFFSATISAIMAIFAAVLAVGYHENLANLLMDSLPATVEVAHAVALVVLFAVLFTVPRYLFDRMIPGNLRFNAWVDKLGGAAMGVVIGMYATGVIAIAAQTMPFGPSILGYSRYPLASSRDLTIPADVLGHSAVDSRIGDTLPELRDEAFDDPSKNIFAVVVPTGLMIPVDDLVMATANKFSQGVLACDRPMDSIHPDYLQELFGQRLGTELGALRVVRNTSNNEQVKLAALGQLTPIQIVDSEIEKLRPAKKSLTLAKPGADQTFMVIRLSVNSKAGDADRVLRFSTACARLLLLHEDERGRIQYQNHYPIGTVDKEGRIYLNRFDDPLMMDLHQGDRNVDLVYLLNKKELGAKEENPDSKVLRLPEGSFIEFKRLATINLAGSNILPALPSETTDGVVRKKAVTEHLPPVPVRVFE